MRWAVLLAAALAACGGAKLQERSVGEMTKHLPATLEAERPREGDPRTVKVRVYADAGARAGARWQEELTDQLDYASQLLTPLCGVRLALESVKPWTREGEPHVALQALAALDRGDDVTWVIGYIVSGDAASKAMSELGFAEPLGKHVIVRAWAERPENDLLVAMLPDLKIAERTEVIAAHRRHKQTAVLLHMLATTLGAIAETDPTWLKHPSYAPKMHTFSERNRELLTLALDDRIAEGTPESAAKKLLDAIEKTPWGGWIPADQEQVTTRLRQVLDATRAGKVAADVPTAAYDQFSKIEALARRGQVKDALIDLDNLLIAYPGNAAMHQLRCELLLRSAGVADKGARAGCARASEVAPGDPSPHLAVGEALARADDLKGARVELAQAEAKIANVKTGAAEKWRRLIETYQRLGALTWIEEAVGKAGQNADPAVQAAGKWAAGRRARYGVPRGKVPPEQEGALLTAVHSAISLTNQKKYAEAEKAIATAARRWPTASGVTVARCDLAFQQGRTEDARRLCGQAAAADPNAAWAHYRLALVVLIRPSPDTTKEAIRLLKRAIEADPDLDQAWRALGKTYGRADDRAAFDALAKEYAARFGGQLPRQ